MILLQLIKKSLEWFIPVAAPFISGVFSVLQFMILLWLLVSIIFSYFKWKHNPFRKGLVVGLLVFVPEALLAFWLRNPASAPGALIPGVSSYYIGKARNIIQLDPAMSVYDSQLFYTLKPSSRFEFSNYEFTDSFFTNKLGLRDDDSSLSRPAIICLGDSFGMGWGVEQGETFAEVLEKATGEKVLNASVSSYGTARELKNLRRLDTDHLRYLVIQYCYNDYIENTRFIRDGYKLDISSEKEFDSAVSIFRWNKLYFPGKHFISLSKLFFEKRVTKYLHTRLAEAREFPPSEAARAFSDILRDSRIDFEKTKVLVFDLNPMEGMSNKFTEALQAVISTDPYRGRFQNNLVPVSIIDLLHESDYFVLDGHLRASGHRKIARRIASIIGEDGHSSNLK